jgi:hypothetical protein
VYGVPLMLAQDDGGRFMTVKFFANTGRNEEDQIFRLENLAGILSRIIHLAPRRMAKRGSSLMARS